MNIPQNYQSLTMIAQNSDKVLSNWLYFPVGKNAILSFKFAHPSIDQPIITKRGKGGGTYAHPLLAAQFASWCDPTFVSHVVAQNTELRIENTSLRDQLSTFMPASELDRINSQRNRLLSAESASVHENTVLIWLDNHPTESAKVLARQIFNHPANIVGKSKKERDYFNEFDNVIGYIHKYPRCSEFKLISLLREVDDRYKRRLNGEKLTEQSIPQSY